ncbi:MAG: hypothetical protein HY461_02060 [Parcubacteria group bacterium]|nr:hypothetical protein [Parcubacteria group bacterium]
MDIQGLQWAALQVASVVVMFVSKLRGPPRCIIACPRDRVGEDGGRFQFNFAEAGDPSVTVDVDGEQRVVAVTLKRAGSKTATIIPLPILRTLRIVYSFELEVNDDGTGIAQLRGLWDYANIGSWGPGVNLLIRWCQDSGLDPEDTLIADGVSGQALAEVIRGLQRRLGFSGNGPDGNLGPSTRQALRDKLRTGQGWEGINVHPDDLAMDLRDHRLTVWVGPRSTDHTVWTPEIALRQRAFIKPEFANI